MSEPMLVYMNRDGSAQLDEIFAPKFVDFKAKKKFSQGFINIAKEELVLLEVEAASICGTDLHILDGKHDSTIGIVLGHEYIGEVIEVGSSVMNVVLGDRVAVDPNIKCGVCEFCRRGLPNMCENMTTLGIFADGGFAEFNIAPAKQLYILPKRLSVQRAVLFEPLSCVLRGIKQNGGIHAGERVLIYGGGPIGCLFALMAELNGASQIVVVEPKKFRREFFHDLSEHIDSVEDDSELNKDYFDVVIHAASVNAIVQSAIEHARHGGRILWFGQQNVKARARINQALANQKELLQVGSYAVSYEFDDAIRVLQDERISFEMLITETIPLSEIERAFELMKRGRAMKILINPKRSAYPKRSAE